jgi:biopolymer transport protein ExbD
MNMTRAGTGWAGPGKYRLPLIALIDVVLFLLLYFMVAGNISTEEAELAAALKSEKGGKGAALDFQPQVLSVEPAPGGGVAFRMGERVVTDRPALAQLLHTLPRENGVFVRVNPGVTVGAAAAAVQECSNAGFTKITYVPAK